ncbi:MAG: amidohydrolase family protein [Rhodobacterales bacterium]|nr:amidohydrolase family protein [Rhodobacterales bacterium]
MHDLVIRNGTLVDGTGNPRFQADIAIDGDKITALGPNVGPGRREVDATGKLVTPGWVDMHTHFDGQVSWDPLLSPSSEHGVTTVVMGNCGVGFAPVKPDERDWLIQLMEGVEDIPGSALSEGIQWDWETFPEYLDAIEKIPHAIDYATQVPHGALRAYVMGERGCNNEPSTADDIAQMSTLVEEALTAGALGFSTSRTVLHKSAEGVPVPGTFASRDEMFGIGDALRRAGHGVFELASEHITLGSEIHWMRELAKETGQPVVFNMSQSDQQPTLWKDLLAELEDAQAAGIPLYGQVAGRAIGVLMNWRTTANPFVLIPTVAALLARPWEEARVLLRDPEMKAKVLAEAPMVVGEFESFITQTFSKMFPMRSAEYEPEASESIAAIAEREGRSPADVAYDILMEDDESGVLYFPSFNYSNGDLEILRDLHSSPATRMGLSDAGAHCGAICDGGMPTFMLAFWTRDRKRGDTLEIEHVVKRQTSETAAFYGLHDRGLLAVGKKADVNIIDYDNLGIDRPQLAFDLPAGGRRLVQKATGYDMTICSGTVIFEGGVYTGALPGQLIRGPQA